MSVSLVEVYQMAGRKTYLSIISKILCFLYNKLFTWYDYRLCKIFPCVVEFSCQTVNKQRTY